MHLNKSDTNIFNLGIYMLLHSSKHHQKQQRIGSVITGYICCGIYEIVCDYLASLAGLSLLKLFPNHTKLAVCVLQRSHTERAYVQTSFYLPNCGQRVCPPVVHHRSLFRSLCAYTHSRFTGVQPINFIPFPCVPTPYSPSPPPHTLLGNPFTLERYTRERFPAWIMSICGRNTRYRIFTSNNN